MTEKTALFRKASFGLRCVLSGAILVLFSVSVAQAGEVGTPPAANAQNVKGPKDAPIGITLSGTDADVEDTLTYEILQDPAFGELSGTPPNVTYTYTAAGDEVEDSFTFRVSDGTYFSAPVTVKIYRFVAPDDNDVPPVGHNQVVRNNPEGGTAITLTGSDAENDPITFKYKDSEGDFINGPNCGTLTGDPPNVIYTYAPGEEDFWCMYALTDGFNFIAEASGGSSEDSARIDIYLTNNPPGPLTNAGGNFDTQPDKSTTLNGTAYDPGEVPITEQNWTCFDSYDDECCAEDSAGESCSSDCTLDNPGQADPTFKATAAGTFDCDYFVMNANDAYSFDRIEIESERIAPSAQTWSIVLLVGFCALIGVRYVRKSIRENG